MLFAWSDRQTNAKDAPELYRVITTLTDSENVACFGIRDIGKPFEFGRHMGHWGECRGPAPDRLHRASPNAKLDFDGGDLLFVREIDDVPFIGSLTIGPYTSFDNMACCADLNPRRR